MAAPLDAAEPWLAGPEVVRGAGGDGKTVSGVVFADLNGNGQHNADEPGVPGVLVSNGLDVVKTDEQGRYMLDVRRDMNLTVVQPSGWESPVD
ncbi:MAG: metallophosphoesterase N-terminal domain-containing protein [Planctomycetota bacterium]